MKEDILEWLKAFIMGLLVVLAIKRYLFYGVLVDGSSMEPTLSNGDRLLISKIPIYKNKYSRGDIVCFRAPDDLSKIYIKRVIGLEGDRIDILDGRVYLNKELLEEDYIEALSYTDSYLANSWKIANGELFVLGDNRGPNKSNDSRAFGPVEISKLEGLSLFRYYPLNNLKKFSK